MAKKYTKVFEGIGKLITEEEDTGILYPTDQPKGYLPMQMKTKAEKKAWREYSKWKTSGITLDDMIPEEMHDVDIRYKITVEAELANG